MGGRRKFGGERGEERGLKTGRIGKGMRWKDERPGRFSGDCRAMCVGSVDEVVRWSVPLAS